VVSLDIDCGFILALFDYSSVTKPHSLQTKVWSAGILYQHAYFRCISAKDF
jgi:hypothetical protein